MNRSLASLVSLVVAVSSLVFSGGCAVPTGEQSGRDETGEEIASATEALAATPSTLINLCSALPGIDAARMVTCLKTAARSPAPGALIKSCKTMGQIDSVLHCMASGARSPKPGALVNACKTLRLDMAAQLSCIQNAAPSTMPDVLVGACFGVGYETLDKVLFCLSDGAASPVPDQLVSMCKKSGDLKACMKAAAPSTQPEVLFDACRTLLISKHFTQMNVCLASAAPSPVPAVLVSACGALPGVDAVGVFRCIAGAAPSATPDVLVDACKSADVLGPSEQVECVEALGGQ